MARTTASEVQTIIETDPSIIVVDADLDPFIAVANELVTELCTGTAGPTPVYTATRLELIERWLSAHFYAIRDPRTTSESAGVSASYESQVDLGLALSRYGQQAKLLDTHGGLASLDNQTKKGLTRTVGVTWLGTAPTTSVLT